MEQQHVRQVPTVQPSKLTLGNSPTKPSTTSQKLFPDYTQLKDDSGRKMPSTHHYVDGSSSAGNSPDRRQNHTSDKPNEY